MTKLLKIYLILAPILALFSGNVIAADGGSGPDSYDMLFIGNSHSAANGLPDLVARLIETGLPGTPTNTSLAPFAPGRSFLSDRLEDGATQQVLESHAWTHVVLQAQKYSSSGLYNYPTNAAETWIRLAKEQNARPILFPEWGRRDNFGEGLRVHNIHLGISSREPACVAPVGLAWDESMDRYPGLNLYAPDGNHSNLSGALLSAYVFYQLFTGQTAADLPYVPEINVSADSQQKLRDVASFVLEANHSSCDEAVISENEQTEDTAIPALSPWGFAALCLLVAGIGGVSLTRKTGC